MVLPCGKCLLRPLWGARTIGFAYRAGPLVSTSSHVIKTILVPTSGSDTDKSVFDAAFAMGRSLGAHLSFFHVNLSPVAAAAHAHLEFCQGPELANALEGLLQHEQHRSAQARKHFQAFCGENQVGWSRRTRQSSDCSFARGITISSWWGAVAAAVIFPRLSSRVCWSTAAAHC